MFFPRNTMRFRDVLDGLANTMMGAEFNTDIGDNNITTQAVGKATNIQGNPTRCLEDIDPARPRFWIAGAPTTGGTQNQRGYKWASGYAVHTGFTSVLPPNSPACSTGPSTWQPGYYSASSRHQGGAHILMGDGAVKFITDSIESGNQRAGTVLWNGTAGRAPGAISPYGLWGAMGTRANSEVQQ